MLTVWCAIASAVAEHHKNTGTAATDPSPLPVMGAIPTKEHQEINQRLERIEAALARVGPAAGDDVSPGRSPRPDAIKIAPSPPNGGRRARGAQFAGEVVADDGPVHGSPAGARFHVRTKEDTPPAGKAEVASDAATPSDKQNANADAAHHPKFALPDGAVADVDSPVSKPVVAPPATTSTAKADRQKFIADMKATDDWRSVQKCPGVKCSWLSCMTVALSFAAGEKVTMESVLRANEMALHYVSMPSVTTAEVYDALAEFVRADRTLRDKLAVDHANFDSEILDEDEQIGDDQGSGDRPPIQSLIQFRKTIAQELSDDSFSMHIFNFDPYLVQEAEAKAQEDEEALAQMEEEEENADLAASMESKAKQQAAKQWQPKNMGAFAILTGYNAALHTVTLAIPHLAPDGTYTLETHQCPLQTLYNACCVKDGYTKRTRGVVRVFRVKDGCAPATVKPKYPISLIDGRQSRGMLSIALDISIAPHILGLGLLHEVVRNTVIAADAKAEGGTGAACGGIDLRGIPVTDVCRTLGLPVGTITATSNRESLPTAAVWYRRYLDAAGLSKHVDVGCVSVTRRDDSDDGAVNIDEDDFFAFLADAVASKTTAVLLSININVAKNVRVVPDGQSPSHFAILLGYDKERKLVQLADVSVKKYRKVWHTSPDLLYRAVIGHGFITASDKGNELAAKFDGLTTAASYMKLARYGVSSAAATLSPGMKAAAPVAFEHPTRNYSMTVLAKGLNTVLGAPKVRVEDLIYNSGFHLSFMLSEHLPILATQRAANYFCYYTLENTVHVETTNFDAHAIADAEKAFLAAVKAAVTGGGDGSAVLVNYNGAALNRFPDLWNGHFGGNLAQVIGFDESAEMLLLEDSNPEPFYRRWACPVKAMLEMMAEKDSIAERPRGFMVCKKGPNPLMEASRLVDMRRAQSHHPFKNPVSSIASAIALALSEVIPGSAVASEEIVYAGESFNLTTLTSQVTPVGAQTMVDNWLAQNPNYKKKVKAVINNDTFADEHKFLAAIAQQPDRVSLILYEATAIFPSGNEKGLAAGVVTRAVEGRPVVVCDGSPTRHGDMWARPAADVHKATKAVLQFTAVSN
uniref:glutathione gamma-glutamylcysteinyltransferase n=1 Tax=Neobodo designis TaxID=312471 RepID=A0A7S1QPD0_NEODS|mmetsp:Transcript_49578/g.153066  ORF Transcript_49578/g.153066 Transcript_49578/m.153066 type:complete len:1091 (+) Transcript_49578:124-3396(+)